jgi:endonuclease YncB( thermonuclease family)
MNKTYLISIMIITLVLTIIMPISTDAGTSTATVYIDGQEIFFDVPPTIVNGRTLVPLRRIFEELGAEITWNGKTQTVTGIKSDTTIKLTIGQNSAYINGEPIPLDVPATIINDRTLVPLRFVSEAMGSTVGWEGLTRSITIGSSLRDKAVVSRVIDGDTIEVNINNQIELFELIGVDAPEFSSMSESGKSLAEEAFNFTKANLEGQSVLISFDEQERDESGRLLGYVFLSSGEFFNAKLLAKGYGRIAVFPPNLRWVDVLVDTDKKAEQSNRGIWGLESIVNVFEPDPSNGESEDRDIPSLDFSQLQHGEYKAELGISTIEPELNSTLDIDAVIYDSNGKEVQPSSKNVRLEYKYETEELNLSNGQITVPIGYKAIPNYNVKIDLIVTIGGQQITFDDIYSFTPISTSDSTNLAGEPIIDDSEFPLIEVSYTKDEKSVITYKNFESAYQNGWIYYSVNSDGIYKQRLDGTYKYKLSNQWGYNLQVQGDWLYYTCGSLGEHSLCRLKTDGSEFDNLVTGYAINPIWVEKDWIYYAIKENNGYERLMKMNINNSEEIIELINNEHYDTNILGLQIVDNTIYFTDSPSDGYKINVDGSGFEKIPLSEGIRIEEPSISYSIGRRYQYLTVYQEWIYYTDGSNLFRKRLGRDELELLYRDTEDTLASDFIIKGNKLYVSIYTNHPSNFNEVMEMDLNGDNKKIISEKFETVPWVHRTDYGLCIFGNTLYVKRDEKFFKIKDLE